MARVSMNQPAPRLHHTFVANESRVQRLITAQEVLLEYSLFIIVLGCFAGVILCSDCLSVCALFSERRPLFDALSNVYQTDVWPVRYTPHHSHYTGLNK